MGSELQELTEKLDVLKLKYLKANGEPRKGVGKSEMAELQELADMVAVLEAEKADADEQIDRARTCEVGDVYATAERSVVVLTSQTKDDPPFMHAVTLTNPGQADALPWQKLQAQSRRIAASTCLHHVNVGNWTFVKNIVAKWES